jgi:hypothetical protein
MALGSVGVVVVIVIALVAVGVTTRGGGLALRPAPAHGSGTGSHLDTQGALPPTDTLAPASVVNAVTGVTPQVADAVGLPPTSTVVPPTVKKGQPALTIDGFPGAIFIGGEFCPYCAAERWAIVMAFSRFGTFSNLAETASSPWDTFPSTPTFSFYGSTYSSRFLTLDTDEDESNDTSAAGNRSVLQPPTPLESALWKQYDNPEGFPFLDIGNSVFVVSPSFYPSVLSGLDQADVAAKLTDPNAPSTQSIVATATYLTAAICSMLAGDSSSWCSDAAVTHAATAMGIS